MKTSNPNLLIENIKKGSQPHFQLLFDEYWERLYNLAKNTLDRPEDAEDVVQEIFIDIWKRRENLEIQNVGGYLYTCVRFGIAKKLKTTISKRTEELYESIAQVSDTESTVEYGDLVAYIDGRISQLPSRCQEVFKLSRYKQLSNKEIAEKLDISLSTVENQINKALKVLKADEILSKELRVIIILLYFL